MTLNVGINGLGRIGRAFLRAVVSHEGDEVAVTAVNDRVNSRLLAHLLLHDTVFGNWGRRVHVVRDVLYVDDLEIRTSQWADPGAIDWSAGSVDVVLECTGAFTSRASASRHLTHGPAAVVITAPAPDVDATILYGINHETWSVPDTPVISAGSCTAHALAPLVTVLRDAFGWRHGHVTTVHPMTPDVAGTTVDDWRMIRGNWAGVVPKSTSAVRVMCEVHPEMTGRLDGVAYRVPISSPAVIDLVAQVERRADAARVEAAFREAATRCPGVLAVTAESLVASDFRGDPHSVTVDLPLIRVINGTQVHVTGWYDNEMGYVHRLIDLLRYAADHHAGARSLGRRARSAAVPHLNGGRQSHCGGERGVSATTPST